MSYLNKRTNRAKDLLQFVRNNIAVFKDVFGRDSNYHSQQLKFGPMKVTRDFLREIDNVVRVEVKYFYSIASSYCCTVLLDIPLSVYKSKQSFNDFTIQCYIPANNYEIVERDVGEVTLEEV